MMKKLAIALVFSSLLCISGTVSAQMPGGNRGMGGQSMNVGHFYGKILESTTNKPLEAASVLLLQNKMDSVTKKRKDVVVAGMLTNKRGEFSLENLPVMGSYKLKITAIGFKTIEQKVNFEINMGAVRNGDMSSALSGVDKDLGNITISPDVQQMEGVTVTASKPQLTMSIDRKIFNVEKNIASVGGTAVDVMKNVPSVNVDIDGNVTLRNAAPQIFVDGRPTTLTLEQIPADEIASVEIITNPSAKFDASGGGSGILNIVLKKNRKAGYNGNINASIDSRLRPGFGGDINVKQGKMNVFARGRIGMRKSISEVNSNRVYYMDNGTAAYLRQENDPINRGYFGFGRIGFDYFLDNRNTITAGFNYMRGEFNNTDLINIFRDTVTTGSTISDKGYRSTETAFGMRNMGTNLSFKHNFAKPNKEWTVDANYNYSKSGSTGRFLSQYFDLANDPKTDLLLERSAGSGITKFFTAQSDFVNPISKTMKMEMGIRGAVRNFSNANSNSIKSGNNATINIPGFSNNYKFSDQVYAAYVTFSHQVKSFSYQLGLRAESSRYEGELLGTGQKFTNEYPFSLFPSAFLTYKLNDKQDLQLNYSRKINRPNFFQLIPTYDISDPLNLSIGNPNLIPEFTNLMELAYQNQLTRNTSILTTLYFKNTNNLITSYQYRDRNPDPNTKPDTVLISTYANANKSYMYGLEVTMRTKPVTWWDFNVNLNLFQSTLQAGQIAGGANNSRVSWFGKINNNFKLPKNYSIQLSGDYQAKTILPSSRGGGGGGMGGMWGGNPVGAQGYTRANYGVDFAIRKDFLKNNAASITLQVNDIFRTKLYSTHSEASNFVQDSDRRRDPQVVRLNFNWRFGKLDVSLFKKKSMKGEMDSMQNATQGMGN